MNKLFSSTSFARISHFTKSLSKTRKPTQEEVALFKTVKKACRTQSFKGIWLPTLPLQLEHIVVRLAQQFHAVMFHTLICHETLYIDFVDPAFAPGTGTPEVGGCTSHETLEIIRSLTDLNYIGFDLVEVLPPYAPAQTTTLLAATLIHDFAR